MVGLLSLLINPIDNPNHWFLNEGKDCLEKYKVLNYKEITSVMEL